MRNSDFNGGTAARPKSGEGACHVVGRTIGFHVLEVKRVSGLVCSDRRTRSSSSVGLMVLIFGAGSFSLDKAIASRLATRTFCLETHLGMHGNERDPTAA